MESWRIVLRDGLFPQLDVQELLALQKALATDDERLLQGATTSPPPLACVADWKVEAACLIGWCGWQGKGLETVREVEEYFAQHSFAIDQTMNEPAGCRWLLNWYDDAPREEMIASLLPEVDRELARREEAACSTEAL